MRTPLGVAAAGRGVEAVVGVVEETVGVVEEVVGVVDVFEACAGSSNATTALMANSTICGSGAPSGPMVITLFFLFLLSLKSQSPSKCTMESRNVQECTKSQCTGLLGIMA
jgi:hypothetical protein